MRLKKITLRNFRCFDELEVKLHPRLTVIVGENGAGKTALLDGIATALSPVLTHLSSASQRLSGRGIKDTDFRIESWEGRGGKERWGVTEYAQVVAETYDGLCWDYWRPSRAEKEPPSKIGVTELKNYLMQIAESYKTGEPCLTPIFAYYGARRGYIEVPERLRESKENYEYPASALIGALDSMSDFKEMLKWFDLEETAELRANKGNSVDEWEESVALNAVRASVVELLGGVFRDPHFNRDHKFVLHREEGAPLLVSQLSQGYQSMLALAMDFSRRLAIGNGHLTYDDDSAAESIFWELEKLSTLDPDYDQKTPEPFQTTMTMSAPAIMLVDEIDLHLHPSWQQRVLHDLMRAFPLTQFIVTTHSPQVLTSVRAECIRGLKRTNGRFVIKDDYQFSEGAEAQLALEDILGATSRPQELDIVKELNLYLKLVAQDEFDTPEALALREKLDAWSHGHEKVLMEADMDIRMRQFRRGKGGE